MLRKVFIAYDFEIKGNLTFNLDAVKKRPPKDSEVEWPGSPGDKSQGAIWKDIVHPRIRWCDRLLAFVDLPNANVGFRWEDPAAEQLYGDLQNKARGSSEPNAT